MTTEEPSAHLEATGTILGDDPPRTHRINANSFQQSALLTVNGWQYAAFYQSKGDVEDSNICYPTIARRLLRSWSTGPDGGWEFLVFDDYEQTFDDGHNTISLGICSGDGTIHVSYDHHCDPLRYRHSVQGLASDPEEFEWEKKFFTATANELPGLGSSKLMEEVSYPRFVSADEDMLFTYRIGQAGSGSDVLYRYSSKTNAYAFLGTLLTGEDNSPYINGLDYRGNCLHVSWTYRRFVEYEGFNDPKSTAHKAQAGPNGPENNYDLCYMYSEDGGIRWSDSDGRRIADLEAGETVKPTTEGIAVFNIPTGSGILNQEGQCIAPDGTFHVLNREKHDDVETWMLYSRHPSDLWKRNPIRGFSPTETGARGSISADKESNLYVILPGNIDSSITVLQALKQEGYLNFKTLWRQDGFDGEPLVDQARLDDQNILSIFTRTDENAEGKRKVVVIDIDLGGPEEYPYGVQEMV
ncbi:hypothetical protein MPH_00959 [Macrophomina phaseolina MS6]|uniref:Uncharacterized protein n=1 Tax=Macrophomina phaseolina (strain MS6) TaxID=1126212 RepID=K2SGZ6_MACPH|nr:hypothetical protein MPH_00959 [Macrophomina phaseolina MS6]